MIAARDNRRGAASYGVNVSRARLAAFAISGFWAAIAGALFAYSQRAIDTQAFDPSTSLLLIIIVVIGGVTSLPGALCAALVLGFLKYGGFSPGVQQLASGFGALVLLMLLPGGLAQGIYGARDALLRWVADRRGLVVPSLLADVRVAGEGERDHAPDDEGRMLAEARAVSDDDQPLLLSGEGSAAGVNGSQAIICPTCAARIPMAEVPDHEHFQVVPS